MAFMVLKTQSRERNAAKIPAKLVQAKRRESGAFVARLAFLDLDLNIGSENAVEFSDGVWITTDSDIMVDNVPVLKGHLRTYRGDMDDEWQRLRDGMDVADTVQSRDQELTTVG
ncbi:MAG TPA: hypothetical protein VMQ58_03155 [Candidatus Saccharimonadales bacterium]|nr:hypothetical protein [Candidatus Saccharimonadales bacterium]